jgi:hypothetical protein
MEKNSKKQLFEMFERVTGVHPKPLYENFYHGSANDFNKFDFNKIGSGDGLSKYGYGLYFTDNPETAMYYAKELALGKPTSIMYEVKLVGLDYFMPWDDQIDHSIYSQVYNSLIKLNKGNDAEQMKQEVEEYDMWTGRNLYEWLSHVVGSPKNASSFLYKNHVNGIVVDDTVRGGKIYVAFSDQIVKIINREYI